jgi:hypothetical protein
MRGKTSITRWCSAPTAWHPVGKGEWHGKHVSRDRLWRRGRQRTEAAALVWSTAELTEALTSLLEVSSAFFWPVAMRLLQKRKRGQNTKFRSHPATSQAVGRTPRPAGERSRRRHGQRRRSPWGHRHRPKPERHQQPPWPCRHQSRAGCEEATNGQSRGVTALLLSRSTHSLTAWMVCAAKSRVSLTSSPRVWAPSAPCEVPASSPDFAPASLPSPTTPLA